MAATGARSAAIAAPASVAARQTPFDRVQSLADLGQDEFIRGGLIDIGHIPVEDGSIFVVSSLDLNPRLQTGRGFSRFFCS